MKKKTIFAILLVGMCLHSDPAYATLVESGPWLTCPGHTPYTDFKDSSDWTGVYYAEGSGIELYIYSDAWEFGYVSDSKEDNTLICELYDYSQSENSIMHYETQRTSEGKLMEANGHFDIADAGDGTYSASFDNSVFGNSKILSFKKIPSDWKQQERLPDWQGCFRSEYDSDTDYRYYVSIVNLYGTNDYVMYFQVERYQVQQPYYWTAVARTWGEDLLVNPYEADNGLTMYWCYGRDERGNLIEYYTPMLEDEIFDVLGSEGYKSYQFLWKGVIWE